MRPASRPACPRSSDRPRTGRTSTPGIARTVGSWPGASTTGRSSAGSRRRRTRAEPCTPGSPGRASTSRPRRRARGSVAGSSSTSSPRRTSAGLWTLFAGVLADNAASLAVHERVGFRVIGVQERLGQDAVRALARRRPARAAADGSMSFDVAAEAYDRFMGRYSMPLAPQLADLAGIPRGPAGPRRRLRPGRPDPRARRAARARRRRRGRPVRAVRRGGARPPARRRRAPGDGGGPALRRRVVRRRPGPARRPLHDRPGGRAARDGPGHPAGRRRRGLRLGSRRRRRAAGAVLARGPRARSRRRRRVTAGRRPRGPSRSSWRPPPAWRDRSARSSSSRSSTESFEVWWEPYTRGVGPAGAYVAGLDDAAREALRATSHAELGDGPFTITARAWAVRGVVQATVAGA